MREVLISIQPKWCELIASGKKTVEVRKTRPKTDVPFKCYIYQTKLRWVYTLLHALGFFAIARRLARGTGKVIGEFVCDKITEVYQCNSGWVSEYACISQSEFFDYLGIPRGTHFGYDKKAYAWHISDLVIYEQPKELSEFYRYTEYEDSKNDKRPCYRCEYNQFDYSENHEYCSIDYDGEHCVHLQMKRPPQSWCYVELLKGGADNV